MQGALLEVPEAMLRQRDGAGTPAPVRQPLLGLVAAMLDARMPMAGQAPLRGAIVTQRDEDGNPRVLRRIAGEDVWCDRWRERYACGHAVEYTAPWRGDYFARQHRELEHLRECLAGRYVPDSGDVTPGQPRVAAEQRRLF